MTLAARRCGPAGCSRASTTPTLDRCRGRLRTRRFRRGEVIFHEDDPGDSLFIVMDGSVKIMVSAEDGTRADDPGDDRTGRVLRRARPPRRRPAIGDRVALEAGRDTRPRPRRVRPARRRAAGDPPGAARQRSPREIRRLTAQVEDLHFLDLPGRLARHLLRLAPSRGEAVGGTGARGRDPPPVAVHAGRAGRDDRGLAPVREPPAGRFRRAGPPALRGRRAGHPGSTTAGAGGSPLTGEGREAADERRAAALDLLIALAVRLHAADRIAPPPRGGGPAVDRRRRAVAMRVTAVSVAVHDAATDRLVFRVAAGPEGGGVVGLRSPRTRGSPVTSSRPASPSRSPTSSPTHASSGPRPNGRAMFRARSWRSRWPTRTGRSASWSSSTDATACRSTSSTSKPAARFAAALTVVDPGDPARSRRGRPVPRDARRVCGERSGIGDAGLDAVRGRRARRGCRGSARRGRPAVAPGRPDRTPPPGRCPKTSTWRSTGSTPSSPTSVVATQPAADVARTDECDDRSGSPRLERRVPARRPRRPRARRDRSGPWIGPPSFGDSDGAGVTVAIIDSGVEGDHPAVGGRLSRSLRVEVGDGFRVVDDPDAVDLVGHGTACAGIIHAIAPAAELVSIRVLGADNRGGGAAFAAALEWAIGQGFGVVNLSLSSRSESMAGRFHELADAAYFANTLLVCAANNVTGPSYPSLFAAVRLGRRPRRPRSRCLVLQPAIHRSSSARTASTSTSPGEPARGSVPRGTRSRRRTWPAGPP